MPLILWRRVRNIKTIKGYQEIFEAIVTNIIDKSIDNFSVSGIENISRDKSYLFISNHRDITLDSASIKFNIT